MRFPAVHLISALPFVVSVLAQPEKLSPRSPSGIITIPISKRQNVKQDGTVNIPVLKASLQRSGSKLVNAMFNYVRNTAGTSTDGTGASLSPRSSFQTATEALVDYQDLLWYGNIEVGYPPQKFQVDFDTGSSDLWLMSTLCNSANCDGHALYDPGTSSTAIDLKKTTNLTYGDSDWAFLEQYTDTVSVAGLTAYRQTLGAVLTETDGFNATNFPVASGLLGMGYQTISAYNAPPFFQTLVAQGDVAKAQFSFYLADNESELILGGTDPTRYKGDFTYLPVTNQGYWETDLGGVQVGGKSVQFSEHRAVMDTGTTLIVGNKSNVDAIYVQIPESGPIDPKFNAEGLYTFPCNSSIDLRFMFAGKEFSVPSDVFNLGPVDNTTNTTCVGGLAWDPYLLAHNFTLWIMGDLFLRNYYSLYDLDENRIGLAKLN